jgi:hypothetical protein
MIAFCRVIINYIEDHLNARSMHFLHHVFKFYYLFSGNASAGIAHIGRKKTNGIITPIIGETFFVEVAIGNKMMYGHQLNRGNTQLFEIADGNRMGKPCISTSYFFRYIGVELCESFYMRFVDHRFMIRYFGRAIFPPVKVIIDDHAFGNKWGAVQRAEAEVGIRMADFVAKQCITP